MKRREILSTFLKTLGAAVAGIITIPLGIHALSPLLQSEPNEDWKPLGPIDKFPIGKISPALVNVSGTPAQKNSHSMEEVKVFVWRKDVNDFVVYSRSCTDLGCPLNYDSGSEWFFCPCHGGIFDKEGQRQAGPPKKPMWRYAFRIQADILEIDLRSVPAMA